MARTLASLLVIFFSLFFIASASPVVTLVAKAAQDVFVPRIIKPDIATVWVVGQPATVVWDTSDAPASISNGASVLLHGYGVVAQGFDLRAGNVTFQVPPVDTGAGYIITLFGDSSNTSPPFTIVNI